jgi:dihydropteroate synthase
MPAVVKAAGAGIVLMHSRGTRDTLHLQARMADPIAEVGDGLSRAAQQALGGGIPAESIVIDPGIGFGKAAEESIAILKSLSVFSKIRYPVLVGTSRKSFIRLITSHERSEWKPDRAQPSINVEQARGWGTAATVVVAIMNGAHVVRVHDVRQTRVLADVTDRLV